MSVSSKALPIMTVETKWIAALWKILACLCFALINGLVRYLTGGAGEVESTLSFSQITFFQNLLGALILLPFFARDGFQSLKTHHLPMLLLMVVFAVAGLLTWYAALKYMAIAQAVALAFTGPIFTVIGCRLFLKESLTFFRIGAIVVSIVGSFFITRPDKAFMGTQDYTYLLYSFLPMFSAIAWVGCKLCTKILVNRGESASMITFYLLLFMAPVSLIPALWDWVMPSMAQLGMTLIIGLLACVAHIATARAFMLADVSFLMPFGITRLLLSGVIGYVLFAEIPKNYGIWIGMGVILFSLVLLAKDSRRFSV